METQQCRTVALWLGAVAIAACSSSSGVTGSTDGLTGSDSGPGGGLPDVAKVPDVPKLPDVPKVDVAKPDGTAPDVTKPDSGVDIAKPDAGLPDTAQPDTSDVSTPDVPPDVPTDAQVTSCSATQNFCASIDTLQQCDPSTGEFKAVPCTDAQCASQGKGVSVGCVTSVDTGGAECGCDTGNLCNGIETICVNKSQVSLCNPDTGVKTVQTCGDAACQQSGQGVSIGCGISNLGIPACLCSGGSTGGGCTTADESCQGNTLHFCDPISGEMQTFVCTDAECAAAGFQSLLGCMKDQDGIFNCLCNP